jgi:hypothetical protein
MHIISHRKKSIIFEVGSAKDYFFVFTVLGETGWDGWKDGFWLLYRLYGQVPVHFVMNGPF